ncbi:hypothetical protein PRIPAC_73848 [Pristionchus pacificus]|uniref:Uncharacterized protein n=1 Tax=Pristionchus pacificus TaxID=54126 RepID=A0A2A6C0U2_PRIPA|nr:hypothetical protein PRIPAC_73848 [Pristionchus pacificus]|eukprot:PDM71651.1 hypothetical protein PRIPAC_38058 [Pristionchus pacificus]
MSAIECLPKELIWSIIEYAPETVHHLRLASQTLCRRVNEYANFRSSDRSIDQPDEEVLIRGDYTQGLGEIHIRILIHVRMTGLFELRLKHRNLALYASRTTGRSQWSYTSRIQYDCNASQLSEYSFILSESALLEALGQCIGSRISFVRALYFRWPLQFKSLSYLFRGITITKYVVGIDSISQEIGIHILDLVKSCNIERFGISLCNVFISDPVQYLLELSSLVRSLYIMQEPVDRIVVASKYFFGVKDANWGKIASAR